MKLNFNLGTSERLQSLNNTPSLSAQRLPFYTTAVGHFFAGPDYFTEREGLENSHLVLYTLAGRGRLKYRNYNGELNPGQAAIIACGEYQYYATASDEPWEFKWVHIGGPMAGEYEERINKGSLTLVVLDRPCKTEAAMDSILQVLDDRDDYLADVKISGALADMLTEMATSKPHLASARLLHRQEMERALQYIRANFNRKIDIDEIISGSHLSKFYFLRQFKEYTGLGLYEYLNNHRIDMAKWMLKDAGCTVGGVAQSVGFADVNCFIRYFKKVTGTTPATFKKYYLY